MKRKEDGFAVTHETATPLRSGMHAYWSAHWKNVVLDYLSSSHPNVAVEYDRRGDVPAPGAPAQNPRFRAVFRKDDRAGRETCGPSRSLAHPKTTIPEAEVDKLVSDLDRLHKEAENASNPEGARRFAREYKVPDPRQMRDAWRVSRGPVKKLVLLWGYHPNGAANDVVLPLTPTSSAWDDAKRRVSLKDALRDAGVIGKSRLDWGWILSRILFGAALLLLLTFLAYVLARNTDIPFFRNTWPNKQDTGNVHPNGSEGSGGSGDNVADEGKESVGNDDLDEEDVVHIIDDEGPPHVDGPHDDRHGSRNHKGRETTPPILGGGGGEGGENVRKVKSNPPKPHGPNPPIGDHPPQPPQVHIPDFTIRLKDAGRKGDGSFDPAFELVSQQELPGGSVVRWSLDGAQISDETTRRTMFKPHFPDSSPHEISAWISMPGARGKETPVFKWAPDAGADGESVRRFIEQIGEREDGVGTYFLFDVGSDPQDGKASVLSWRVEKVEPSKREIEPTFAGGDTNVLQVHSKDIAGNAQIEITANVAIAGKGEREVKATRVFGVSSGDTSDSLSAEEARRLQESALGVVPSVYLVVTPTGTGTGFAVTKKLLATNRHVVENTGEKVTLYASRSDKPLKGRVKSIDAGSDLALVELLDKVEMTGLALAGSSAMTLRQPVACVGFSVPALNAETLPNGGFEPAKAYGVLRNYNPWAETAFSDLKAFHGNSGSPVVDEQGKVVGVVFGGSWDETPDKEIDERSHRSCLVTLRMLKKFLEANGVR